LIALTEAATQPAAKLTIELQRGELQQDWDQYVEVHPAATLFHSAAWKRVVERSFGFEPRYLTAKRGDDICGVLPLFLAANWVQGRTLISSPFAVYGGILASEEEARQELCQAACRMAVEDEVQYLELREPHVKFGGEFHTKNLYVTFEQELPSDPAILLKQLPKDTRYMIRKGQKAGLRTIKGNDQLDQLHDIYAQSVRHLGTPVFAKRYFRILLEEFGSAAETTVIWNGSTAAAAVLSFRFRDQILPYYGGSLVEARALAANNFMYWEVLRGACERGIRRFDFGRSKLGTGSYSFKSQWNMLERALPYQFYLVNRKTLPNFSPVNPRFKLATDLWKKMPIPLTKAFGPALVKLFP
jgi:FemAB-related protein (PEP-CTERM system-associated)